MPQSDENMDEICAWLERLARWIDRGPLPTIPYAGYARAGLRNPPAPHLEIAYLVHGGFADARIGSRQVRMPEGHVYLFNVHFGNHSPRLETTLDSWCIFFDVAGAPAFRALAQRPVFHALPVGQSLPLAAAFEEVAVRCMTPGHPQAGYPFGPAAYAAAESRQVGEAARLRIKASVLNLLAVLLEEAVAAQPGTVPPEPRPVRAAVEHIRRAYNRPGLALGDLAGAANLSVDHFGRLFRRCTGLTPMDYLKRVRLDRGRLLLQQTDLRVSEIAGEVGFPNPLHFSRVFRAATGVSPRQFRQRSRRG